VLIPLDSVYAQCETLRQRAGVFVTIRRFHELRGCVGTLEPTYGDTALEIIENAIAAAFRDPRFTPVCSDELADLSVSVDILKPMEPIRDTGELNPMRYGVVVRSGDRRGLLLPGIEQITSIEEQIAIARAKGDIEEHEPVDLYRFEVDRYH
jgi:AmmeMemoRadiSam system protein A